MLRLNLKKEPYWIDLPADVKVKVRPLSTAIMSAAQSSVIKRITDWRQERKSRFDVGADMSDVPDVDDEETRLGLSESLLIKALARWCMTKRSTTSWIFGSSRRIFGSNTPVRFHYWTWRETHSGSLQMALRRRVRILQDMPRRSPPVQQR